jgi:hypothetical protein
MLTKRRSRDNGSRDKMTNGHTRAGACTEISACRVSGSKDLVSVLNLGRQALTGVFPRTAKEPVTEGPLELVWCPDSGLLQLKHS